MKGLPRLLFVGGLSIAIAGSTLLGSSTAAFAAGTRPTITSLSVPTDVNEGDKPTVTGTFTDPDSADQHTVQIWWGDGSTEFYTLAVGDRSFSLQKSVGYPDDQRDGTSDTLTMQVTLSDGSFSINRFPSITVSNVAPSVASFGLSSTELEVGQTVTATGGFDDPGVGDTHTVTVNWGDGTDTKLTLARRVWAFSTPVHTFDRGGTFTVTATVADDDGGTVDATSSVTVNGGNQAPSVVSFGVPAGNEGDSSTLSLSFADADAADTHTVTIAWGDGTTSDPVLLASDETTYSTTHMYADTGTYHVVLTLEDSAGHSVTAAASVSPRNIAPTVGALTLSPASVVDHQMLTVSGDFVDPGTADTFTLTVNWGDGKSSTETLGAGIRSFSATHAYDKEGPVTITATVADRDNDAGSSTTSIVVVPSNHAPADLTVDATAVLEGGTTTLTVSFSDAEPLDTHTVAISWGDASTESVSAGAGATTATATHTYAETGSYAVAVTVTDAGGLSVTGATTVEAGNVAPTVASLVLSPSSVTDHQTLTLNGTFTDPGTADTFTVSIDWGDDSAASTQSLAAGTRTFTATHDYAAARTYVVTATVTDRDHDAGTRTSSVVVGQSNRAPSSLSLNPTVNGSSVVVSATFADPDLLDEHTVTVSWGDATTTMNLGAGVTSFMTSYAYSLSGTYTVSATVTDPSGASADANVRVVVNVSAGTASELLDQMKMLVRGFELDRNTERWLLRRIDEIKASLSNGNTQLCYDLKTLSKVAAFGSRTLSSDQWAALSALAASLESSAQCPGTVRQSAQSTQKKTVVTPLTVLTPATPTSSDKNKSDKSEKSVASDKSANSDEQDKQTKAERKGSNRSGGRE